MVQSSSPGYIDPKRFPVIDDEESVTLTDSATGTGLIIPNDDNDDSISNSKVSSSETNFISTPSMNTSSQASNTNNVHARNRSISPSIPISNSNNYSDNDQHSLLTSTNEQTNTDNYNPEYASDPVGMALEAIANAERGYRQCRWCEVAQPARAHHCKECNKCVALFDHHCNVINTCIGERNHFRFWLFLGFESASIATAIGILNTAFIWRRGMGDWIGTNALALITLIILWLTQLYVFGLFVFHTWLGCTNTTTYETTVGAQKLWYLAGTEPKDCDLPFSKGICGNIRLFCCTLDSCCSKSAWKAKFSRSKKTSTNTTNNTSGSTVSSGTYEEEEWYPHEWERAKTIDRESTDICRNIWENRYYSCC